MNVNLPVWKTAPFIRILVPFVAGILIQWYFQPNPLLWTIILIPFSILYIVFFFLPIKIRYKWGIISGIAAIFMLTSLGALITWYNDIRNDPLWFGKNYQPDNVMLVKLEEPLVEKPNSWKSSASVEAIYYKNTPRPVPASGNILIYFQKDSTLPKKLGYGTQVLFNTKPEPVHNTGNPGSFDYRRYCLFKEGITHQVFLKTADIIVLPEKKVTWFRKFIFTIQDYVLSVIRANIKSEKEVGLAEALLIGYQYDVDRILMQSYSNTGVVHVIAISGLHLGVIYWLLVVLLKPLSIKKKSRYLSPCIIIICLWIFSILAGAQPAILRASVMFTFLVIGKTISRNMPIINSLAASAFLLLCVDPFWIWNIGFQLSYAALLSLVIFNKSIYNIIYIKNKGLDQLWQLTAISIAAQLLTTPFSVYYFDQFPVWFIITNLVAVPLSSLILLGEIFLCATSWIPVVAVFIGKALHFLIWLMNTFVEYMESLPFSMWQGLSITVLQAILLIVIVAGFGYWLMEKHKTGCWTGITAAVLFLLLRSWSFLQASRQSKLIVYNVPKCQAIDIISGRQHIFIADDKLKADISLQNFHLKPSWVMHRLVPARFLRNVFINNNLLQFGSKRIVIIDRNIKTDSSDKKIAIDLLIISRNPKVYITEMVKVFDIKQIVIDGTASLRKIKYWKRDCDSLHIPCHLTNEKGAFIMDI